MPTTSVVPPSSVECAPLFSISLSLSLSESSFVRVFLLPLTFYIILFCFVSPRCPITWKRKFAERDSSCCRKFKLKCKEKKKPLSWSVISVTQSPRSTKIMMNVRGKLPTRIQHFKLPRGHVTVNGMSFCCSCCCCFFLTTKRQLTKDNFVISIQPWHGPGCLQEKEAWGKYTATGCLSSRFQNVIVFHSKVAQREIVLLFSPLRSDYRKATPRSYQQLFDGTEETGACCLWKTGL